MEQATSTKYGGELNLLDSTGLCLLSLDGGGVRGLSTLYILKSIMDRLNYQREKTPNLPRVKPCEVFDLIGGTSTGGLIAIMLGRLEMDVDECITAYSDLAETVFGEKLSSFSFPFNVKGKVKPRFDLAKLENAIQKVVVKWSASGTDLLNDGTERGCRTFVCTADRNTKDIVRLRSYNLPDEPNIRATICQAALATSAATTFFDAVSIGDRTFADGGLGANNPVDEVEGEASNIWCSETGDLKPLVKCFISIGTGNPGEKSFEDSIIKFLSQTMVEIATETENTEKRFIARWAKHFDEKRYYRFNVDQGLQSVGLDEYRKKGPIEAATERYLTHTAQKLRVRDCIQNLRLKQNKTEMSFAAAVNEYTVRTMRPQPADHAHRIAPFDRNPGIPGHLSSASAAPSGFHNSQSEHAVAQQTLDVHQIISNILRPGGGSSDSDDEETLMHAEPFKMSGSAFTQFPMSRRVLSLVDNIGFLIPTFVASFQHYDYRESFERKYQQRYPSTCEWVTQNDDILWWCKRNTSTVLWISGAPGLGKSTLLAHFNTLLRNRPEHLNIGQSCAVIYSFCDDQRNNTASKVLSVAIHQMLIQFPELQKPMFKYDRSNFTGEDRLRLKRPKARSAPTLWNIFCKIVKESKVNKVVLVVDALDECDGQSQKDLIRLFHSTVPGPPFLQILFSSRPNGELAKQFSYWSVRAPGNFRHQKLGDQEDFINRDIETYIRGEVARIGDLRALSTQERTLITEKLMNERSGVFLPVTLLLAELENENEESRGIVEILDQIPKDSQDLYRKLLAQIPESIRSQPSLEMKYLMYSFVPLTVRELAFASTPAKNRIEGKSFPDGFLSDTHLARFRIGLRCLGTMLRLRDDDDTVTFIHVSAKEFLIERSLTNSDDPFLFKPWKAHRDIAIECLKLVISKSNLNFPAPWQAGKERNESRQEIKSYALLSYAMQYWHAHLKAAVDGIPLEKAIDPELIDLVKSFTQVWNTSTEGFRWTNLSYSGIEGLNQERSQRTTVFEILSALGLTAFLQALLKGAPERYRQVTTAIQSAILLAIRGGHESTVDLLIEHFNITSLDDDAYKSVIEDSAWARHPSLLQKIMRLRKPRLNELIEATTIAFTTGERDTLSELSRDRSVFKDRNPFGRTALHEFFISGRSSTAPTQALAQALYFVRNGVDINAKDRWGFAALHYACWNIDFCTKELIEGLIRNGADPISKSNGGLTSFYFAVRYAKSPDVIQSMLQISSNQLAVTRSRGRNTPLHWAVQRGARFEQDVEILQLLVKNGADPHVQNRHGFTPIQYAYGSAYGAAYVVQSAYENLDGVDNYRLLWQPPDDMRTPSVIRYSIGAESRITDQASTSSAVPAHVGRTPTRDQRDSEHNNLSFQQDPYPESGDLEGGALETDSYTIRSFVTAPESVISAHTGSPARLQRSQGIGKLFLWPWRSRRSGN